MTREQELQVRTWVGTNKHPKVGQYGGRYLGMDKDGRAMIKSPHTGKIIKFDKDGNYI